MISITHRRPMPVPRDVSQGTLAKVDCGATRKYVSGFRRGQGERTRAAIVEATLALVAAGNFRPDALTIGARVGCHPSAIMRHFGALHLLYRVIAREHAGAVLEALGIEAAVSECGSDPRTTALQDALVWIVMTGARRAP